MADLGRQFAGLVQLVQQVPRPWIKGLASGGQPWLARRAFEQRCLQVTFQFLDLPAQGRLGNEQALGGSTETAGVGDFDEITQLAGGNHKSCLFEMSDGL